MKEFIDKLISRLEEVKEKHQPTINGKTTMRDLEVYKMTIGYAKEIVNELAEEYINTSTISKMENVGWIPCSSGYFSTSEVLVCKEDGTIDFDVYDFMDNDWKFNSNHHKNKVIAWQPLPAPFKEGE